MFLGQNCFLSENSLVFILYKRFLELKETVAHEGKISSPNVSRFLMSRMISFKINLLSWKDFNRIYEDKILSSTIFNMKMYKYILDVNDFKDIRQQIDICGIFFTE